MSLLLAYPFKNTVSDPAKDKDWCAISFVSGLLIGGVLSNSVEKTRLWSPQGANGLDCLAPAGQAKLGALRAAGVHFKGRSSEALSSSILGHYLNVDFFTPTSKEPQMSWQKRTPRECKVEECSSSFCSADVSAPCRFLSCQFTD